MVSDFWWDFGSAALLQGSVLWVGVSGQHVVPQVGFLVSLLVSFYRALPSAFIR